MLTAIANDGMNLKRVEVLAFPSFRVFGFGESAERFPSLLREQLEGISYNAEYPIIFSFFGAEVGEEAEKGKYVCLSLRRSAFEDTRVQFPDEVYQALSMGINSEGGLRISKILESGSFMPYPDGIIRRIIIDDYLPHNLFSLSVISKSRERTISLESGGAGLFVDRRKFDM